MVLALTKSSGSVKLTEIVKLLNVDLSEEEAKHILGFVITRMEMEESLEARVFYVEAISNVNCELSDEHAERAFEALLQTYRNADLNRQYINESMTELCRRFTRQQVRDYAFPFYLGELRRPPAVAEFTFLTKELCELAKKLTDEEIQHSLDVLIDAIEQNRYKNPDMLEDRIVSLTSNASPVHAISILKSVVCVDGFREKMVSMLGARAKTDFAGDIWEATAWVDAEMDNPIAKRGPITPD